jgi:hypothetical protein
MRLFMNALYNAVGSTVTGYDGPHPFIGRIVDVRAMAGDDLRVTVELDDPCGNAPKGDHLLFSGKELYDGGGNLSSNLHVYFD